MSAAHASLQERYANPQTPAGVQAHAWLVRFNRELARHNPRNNPPCKHPGCRTHAYAREFCYRHWRLSR